MTAAAEKEKGHKSGRFQEPAKLIPLCFVLSVIALLYLIYMTLHCAPLLSNPVSRQSSVIETLIFNILTFLLLTCYAHCVMIHPGTVPDRYEDPSWEYAPPTAGQRPDPDSVLQETKRTGERRHCKWCNKYKPDRCHHCRICRTCILKMDHHCPWMYNCIGFRNYKYFFLLFMYCAIVCHYIFWSMMGSVKDAVSTNANFMKMFLLLFGETLSGFLSLICTCFFMFHVWLMLKAMSTIEFCEKSMKKGGYDSSVYSLGTYGNIKAVLGDYPYLWLLPCSTPPGRGLYYLGEDTKLKRDLEPRRGSDRKAKKSTSVPYGSTMEDTRLAEEEGGDLAPKSPSGESK